MDSNQLLIVWHSRTGASRAMAHAAAEGAGKSAVLRGAEHAQVQDLLTTGAYLFVCPENLASVSGLMKDFFDRCYYPALGHIQGRAYATAIAAGSDGTGATRQIDRIAKGWRLRRVADPMIANFEAQDAETILAPKRPTDEQLEDCRLLGAAMAEGLILGIF